LNILILTPAFPYRGSPVEGLFNEQHALALARAGNRVSVIVVKPWLPLFAARKLSRYHDLRDLPRREERAELRISYSRYLHFPRFWLPKATVSACLLSIGKTVRRNLSREKFDIIQVHTPWPAGLAGRWIAKKLGCPFIVTLHIEEDPLFFRRQNGPALYRRMLEEASAVVGVGRPTERFLRERFPEVFPKSFFLIPNGVDLIGIQRVLRSESSAPDWGRLVSVGNLWPFKGIDLSLKALAKLRGWGVPWKEYTVVGDGPELSRLQKLARELGIADKVSFKGRLEHCETLGEISRADIFALPSWREAFGIVYLEAMACGKPVIGCSGQGAEDIIRDGKDGLLVRPQDVDHLAAALRRLIENPGFARELGAEAAHRAREFTWERNAARYLEIYETILAGKGLGPSGRRTDFLGGEELNGNVSAKPQFAKPARAAGISNSHQPVPVEPMGR
jgi:teichuronic acid biosynthesis glycosyltransferase TuaC